MAYKNLFSEIENVLAKNESRCLDDIDDRVAVRDELYRMLTQMFDIRNRSKFAN